MVLNECRPYSVLNSNHYTIWSDDNLNYDPFGYYKDRLTAEKHIDNVFPYFLDYPVNDNKWHIGEIFEYDFDDTDYAGE